MRVPSRTAGAQGSANQLPARLVIVLGNQSAAAKCDRAVHNDSAPKPQNAMRLAIPGSTSSPEPDAIHQAEQSAQNHSSNVPWQSQPGTPEEGLTTPDRSK